MVDIQTVFNKNLKRLDAFTSEQIIALNAELILSSSEGIHHELKTQKILVPDELYEKTDLMYQSLKSKVAVKIEAIARLENAHAKLENMMKVVREVDRSLTNSRKLPLRLPSKKTFNSAIKAYALAKKSFSGDSPFALDTTALQEDYDRIKSQIRQRFIK